MHQNNQQTARANPARELIIRGVPYKQGEDTYKIVHNILTAAHGIALDERDFTCIRALNRNKTREQQENMTHTPKIIVQLATRHLKDRLRKRPQSTLTLRNTGIGDIPENIISREIHINENLTEEQSRLFYLARQKKIELGYRFAWTQDGVVLMRREEGGMVEEIASEAALRKLVEEEQGKGGRQTRRGSMDMDTRGEA